ncbi:hypothetical protein FRC12_012458 [Ceratobasidium sp. 428]|nr:hypothetical protein FRC12_012458 [Ceratobasidium sp. 428]
MSVKTYPVTTPHQHQHMAIARQAAERRLCPLCNKLIPLHMLAQHTEMELAKVNEVILDESRLAEGSSDPTASNRRSAALRARASLTALAPTRRNTNPNPSTHAQTDLEPTPATDRAARQNRRTRHSLGAPSDSMVERRRRRVGGVCPVCEEDVAEDLEEHVDRCLQDAVLPHRESVSTEPEPVQRERSASPELDELVRATDFTDFRGKSRAYFVGGFNS